jgi:two-component sensor histidine kinase
MSRKARWALIFTGWTLLGAVYAVQIHLVYARNMQSPSWRQVIPAAIGFWYIWAALSPLILRLGRTFRFEGRRWVRNLVIHLVCGVLLAMVHDALLLLGLSLYEVATGKGFMFFQRLPGVFLSIYVTAGVIIYWMILFGGQAIDYNRRLREEELRASLLQSQLATAQLQALRMQLHPHFLFNTLHAISALVPKNPEAADKMIARLSDLLRMSLDNAGAQEVLLEQELEFLRGYLDIQKTRFGNRLNVAMDVDPGALHALVPNMILQPLVENAIKHGIAPRASGGSVAITAGKRDGRLMLRIQDDGPGLGSEMGGSITFGLGLSNTRARLEQLYGSAHRFELSNSAEGGLRVDLDLPFKTSIEGDGDGSRSNQDQSDHRG